MNGDFLGFSFDGIHCSSLHITRVSDGNRYNESLSPEIEDKIISIPGTDGSYFFGTNYRSKPITVSIAFDSMTEQEFRQLGRLLSIKKPSKLVFDERPYKVYMAKISAPPQLNYICFDEPKKRIETKRNGIRIVDRENGEITWEQVTPYTYIDEKERIYKGEGTIEFVCIQPYAFSQFKVLDLYGDFDFNTSWDEHYQNQSRDSDSLNTQYGNSITRYNNIEEWAESSGILPISKYESNNIDLVQSLSGNIDGFNAYINLYNPGDIDTNFYLYLPYTNNGAVELGTLEPVEGRPNILIGMSNILVIKPFTAKVDLSEENGVIINSQNHLIEGVLYDRATSTWKTTGNLYNEYILAGDFMKIRARDWSTYQRISDDSQQIHLSCKTAMSAKIHYNYLYY